MFTATIGDWHFWEGTQFMASFEPEKQLYAFNNVDDCVDYLFLEIGDRATARALNYAWKNRNPGLKTIAPEEPYDRDGYTSGSDGW